MMTSLSRLLLLLLLLKLIDSRQASQCPYNNHSHKLETPSTSMGPAPISYPLLVL